MNFVFFVCLMGISYFTFQKMPIISEAKNITVKISKTACEISPKRD